MSSWPRWLGWGACCVEADGAGGAHSVPDALAVALDGRDLHQPAASRSLREHIGQHVAQLQAATLRRRNSPGTKICAAAHRRTGRRQGCRRARMRRLEAALVVVDGKAEPLLGGTAYTRASERQARAPPRCRAAGRARARSPSASGHGHLEKLEKNHLLQLAPHRHRDEHDGRCRRQTRKSGSSGGVAARARPCPRDEYWLFCVYSIVTRSEPRTACGGLALPRGRRLSTCRLGRCPACPHWCVSAPRARYDVLTCWKNNAWKESRRSAVLRDVTVVYKTWGTLSRRRQRCRRGAC